MSIITWLFDKFGYMPKIDMEVGKVNLDIQDTWPFPVVEVKSLAKKPTVKKATTRKLKPAIAAKTARTKKK